MTDIKQGCYIGKAVPITFTDTDVIDPAKTMTELASDLNFEGYANDNKAILKKGQEVRVGDEVYSYEGEDLTLYTYHNIGEDEDTSKATVVLHTSNNDFFIGNWFDDTEYAFRQRIDVGAEERSVYQPHEYPDNETTMDNFEDWTGRYVIFKKGVHDGGHGAGFTYNERWYHLFTEGRGIGGCISPALRFGAFDTSEPHHWTGAGSLRRCFIDTTSTRFNFPTDIKGDKIMWKAKTGINPEKMTFYPKSCVDMQDAIYVRTWCDYGVLYHTTQNFKMIDNIHPLDMGFIYKRKANYTMPFDGQGRTSCCVDASKSSAYFEFIVTEDADRITLVNFQADTVEIKFQDEFDMWSGGVDAEGNTYGETILTAEEVDALRNTQSGKVDLYLSYLETNFAPETPVDERIIKAGRRVRVTLTGNQICIGEIYADMKTRIGNTGVAMSTSYSFIENPKRDEWGVMQYGKAGKLRNIRTTIYSPVKDYDSIRDFFDEVGMQKVIVDGAYTPPNVVKEVFYNDTRYDFRSVKTVGYIQKPDIKTREKDNEIDSELMIELSLEESV